VSELVRGMRGMSERVGGWVSVCLSESASGGGSE
jgi:hypothetical protein